MSVNWERRPILPFLLTETRGSLTRQLKAGIKLPPVVIRRPGVRPPLAFPALYLKKPSAAGTYDIS